MRFTAKTTVAIAALSLPLGMALTPAGLDAQLLGALGGEETSTVVDGEAFGLYVDVLGVVDQKTPQAMLGSGAVMDEASSLSAGVPGFAAAENLFATTTGAGNAHESSAESSSTLENINVLDGLVTADLVVAMSSSWLDHGIADSNADGSTFTNLVVNGRSIGPDVAPNTRIDVPGVGTVILNERIETGNGTSSAGMTVNMIHVILQNSWTGLTTGEIVVGSARSVVKR